MSHRAESCEWNVGLHDSPGHLLPAAVTDTRYNNNNNNYYYYYYYYYNYIQSSSSSRAWSVAVSTNCFHRSRS